MNIKYPNIEVTLVGRDGNAFSIIGAVSKALRLGSVSKEEIDEFHTEVMSGDYDNVLSTAMRWVTVN